MAGGGPGRSSTAPSVDRVTAGQESSRLGADTPSSPADAYRRLDARRAPAVPAAVLAASVVLAGWAVGRRFVPAPRPPVRSWTGGRVGRDRAPPLLAV